MLDVELNGVGVGVRVEIVIVDENGEGGNIFLRVKEEEVCVL